MVSQTRALEPSWECSGQQAIRTVGYLTCGGENKPSKRVCSPPAPPPPGPLAVTEHTVLSCSTTRPNRDKTQQRMGQNFCLKLKVGGGIAQAVSNLPPEPPSVTVATSIHLNGDDANTQKGSGMVGCCIGCIRRPTRPPASCTCC